MKVFKFGGASVRDAGGVRNLASILERQDPGNVLIVVSAMGKTTNLLESLNYSYVNGKGDTYQLLNDVKHYHEQILTDLFSNPDHPVFDQIANTFIEIEWMLEDDPHPEFDFNYDQIVSVGEILSSRIIFSYLKERGLAIKWIDARGYIHTDNTYREGNINMEKTGIAIETIKDMLRNQFIITQGFVGGTSENFTTTLGREGSDYSAAIFASFLKAESLTIWKDVPGVMNCDPKLFDNSHKYANLSYSEALEMSYYGATVIHPKTIKPLRNAGIPLFVKPFLHPEEEGTRIDGASYSKPAFPAIIVKKDQVLVSLSTADLSFISEDILSRIFKALEDLHIRTNMIQVSALSFSMCFDHNEQKFNKLIRGLEQFKIKYNEGLELVTLRHYELEHIKRLTANRTVILEQFSRNTAQFILK
ncbi:MAG: aspartate kinase [Daejeonella sp.]